ncbi:MAG: response regulator [Pyrinomonadaceae bacterium]|nr:response regulator [Sphingobacteriaceae bacterium]
MTKNSYLVWIRLTAILSITVAVLVITGWLFNIESLKTFNAANTMKFNAAISFLMLGAAVYLFSSEKIYPTLGIALTIMVLLLSAVSLSQDVFNYKAYIDEFFVEDTAFYNVNKIHPGRMAPSTAFCFVLIASSLLVLQFARAEIKVIAQYALHVVTLISFIALIGYLFSVPAFYKLSFLASMAISSTLLFFVLSISLTLFNASTGLTSIFTGTGIGNVMAKRLIPVITLVLLVLSYLRLEIHRLNLINVEFGIVLFGLSFLVLSVVMIAITVGHLNKIDAKRHKAEHSLRILNKTLEQKVEERTKELTESQEKFYQIFEMSPVGLMMSDLNSGKFLEVNQSFADLTGYTKAEAEGKTVVELGLVDNYEREQTATLLQEKGHLKNTESYFLNKAGQKRDCLMSVEVVDLGERKVALSVLSDITQQKLAEHALQEAKRVAEESSIAKERFMANMSHEIRTPMNAIIGFTNLIDKTALNEEQGQYLEFIKTSGENLLILINDILDYSKIEAGMMQIETVPFKTVELLHSLEIMFSEKAREKKLQLVTKTDERLPSIVLGDPTRLTQILINLIGNALKFTKEGSVAIDVSLISTTGNEAKVAFSVKDTGIGIPTDKQKEVFERFMQASNETTRNYGGTGLGLSIVKRLVELQKGEISIHSVFGEGTEFKVVLPYLIGEDKPVNIVGQNNEKVEIKKFEKELAVLLAEDNVMNQVLAKKVLTRFGCDVDIAENGGIALEMARIKKYDLVLMDIQMPIMDGYTAAKQMRDELNLDLPIIAMTAHIMAGEREKCIGFGMTDYISKPFKVENLYALIQQYTQG